MTIAVTYRTDDGTRWVSGKGSNLTAAEVDINFWNLGQAIEAIEASAPQPDDISSITQSGTSLVIHLTSGTTFTLAMPVVQFRWRGDWAPATAYLTLDAFKVDGVGVFSVNINHTSASSFDPAAVDGSSNPLYFQMFGVSSLTNLEDLLDVDVTGLADGDLLKWVAADSKWEVVSASGILDAIGSTRGAVLYRGASGWAILAPGTAGQFFQANGSGADPSWVTPAGSVAPQVTKTANYTVTTGDSGAHFDNIGASAEVDFTLPAAARGLTYAFLVDAVHTVKLICNGSDVIAVGGVTPSGTLQANTAASFVSIEAHKSGVWVTSSIMGSWS